MVGRIMGRGLAAALLAAALATGWAQERVVYKCPGNLYTDTLNAKEAEAKGCRTIEGAPVTVIQSTAPRRAPDPAPAASRPADTKVTPADQKARDSDKRAILEAELKREEERLVQLKQAYANGQPERLGNERNYQKYLDRVAGMKADIDRSESDIAALKRELAKLGSP